MGFGRATGCAELRIVDWRTTGVGVGVGSDCNGAAGIATDSDASALR
ncbi:hypothetical protein [Catenulispora sp. EB89]